MQVDIVPAGITVLPPRTEIGGFVPGDKEDDGTRSSVNMVIVEPLSGKASTVPTLAT